MKTSYVPPQPVFKPCHGCGATVLFQIATWEEMRQVDPATSKAKLVKVPVYRQLEPAVNPVEGFEHKCHANNPSKEHRDD